MSSAVGTASEPQPKLKIVLISTLKSVLWWHHFSEAHQSKLSTYRCVCALCSYGSKEIWVHYEELVKQILCRYLVQYFIKFYFTLLDTYCTLSYSVLGRHLHYKVAIVTRADHQPDIQSCHGFKW